MNIPGKIYFDKITGQILLELKEQHNVFGVVPTSVEQDVETFKVLFERNRDSFDVLELEYGQYAQDFAESNGYRVNPDTKELEFSYPDPSEPEQPPVYQEPLSTQVEKLKERQDATENALLDLLLGGM